MATLIRPEISEKNQYWISKHRHYELKHFCLQYRLWKKEYHNIANSGVSSSMVDKIPGGNLPSDLTAKHALMKAFYSERIELIERTAKDADEFLHNYILKAVTEGLSYTYLRSVLRIPCSRDIYYDRYRRFFWLLSNSRN